jgi:hypothetical protein
VRDEAGGSSGRPSYIVSSLLKLKQTIKLTEQSSIPVETQKLLIPKDAREPTFYGLPKIHKPEVLLRLIVSATGSPTHQLARQPTYTG